MLSYVSKSAVLAVALIAFAAVARAEVPVLPPEKANPVSIPLADAPPTIDGRLDDAIWQRAAVLRDFVQIQPGDNSAPLKPTEVRLAYDAKTLYVAFHCHEDPAKVRATLSRREAYFASDDYVVFYLDTFNDKRRAFVFVLNPLGIQGDGIFTEGRGEDYSVELVWESKGQLTEDGYTIEVAIPFKSLRYEAGEGKIWNAHFFRRVQHANRALDSWMPNDRENSSSLRQAGQLTGFVGIDTEHNLEPVGQLRACGHLVRDARRADLLLGANDALGQSCRRSQKCAGDLLCRQTAYFAQRERDLCLRRNRRMAAGKDQSQTVVFNPFIILIASRFGLSAFTLSCARDSGNVGQ